MRLVLGGTGHIGAVIEGEDFLAFGIYSSETSWDIDPLTADWTFPIASPGYEEETGTIYCVCSMNGYFFPNWLEGNSGYGSSRK